MAVNHTWKYDLLPFFINLKIIIYIPSGDAGGVDDGICLYSGSGRCIPCRCWYRHVSVSCKRLICLPHRGRYCKRVCRAGLHFSRPCACKATRTSVGLYAGGHRLAFRWVDSLGGMDLPVVRNAHSQHRAYQKLWITHIIKSITLSKAILTMNMYIIAHQFIFKIICLDNIKLLTQFMC